MGFLAIGIDPTEDAAVLSKYQTAQGYPWPAAVGDRATLETYRVTQTATKYAVDRQGAIAYYRGYGVESAGHWADLLTRLAAR